MEDVENEILFIDRTIKHIRLVQDNIILLEKNRDNLPFKIEKWFLMNRLDHDFSKFNCSMVENYLLTNEYYRNKRLGLPYDHINLNELKKTWDEHKRLERHHPEFKTSMSDIDICEMCCDQAAIAQEFEDEDYTEYFRENLVNEAPLVKKYEDDCLKILLLLQELNNKNEN